MRGSITSASVCRDSLRGGAVADAGHLDDVVRVGELAQRAAVPQLQLLGFLGRRAQRHRDVVGDLVAGDRDHRRVADRAVGEHRDVGRAAADVDQADAQLLLVVVQHRDRRGERLQDHVLHLEAAAAHALDDVLDRRHRAGDDVHLHLEPHAAHAERLAHVLLPVDDEFLRQDVQDLLVVRDRDRLRRLDDAVDVGLRDFLLLDRDHAARVEAADVAAGDAGVDLGDPAVGHQLGLLQHALDRRHRRLDVDDDAASSGRATAACRGR